MCVRLVLSYLRRRVFDVRGCRVRAYVWTADKPIQKARRRLTVVSDNKLIEGMEDLVVEDDSPLKARASEKNAVRVLLVLRMWPTLRLGL